jgi:hypothetical protein
MMPQPVQMVFRPFLETAKRLIPCVTAGLVPAIPACFALHKRDARDKRGHDHSMRVIAPLPKYLLRKFRVDFRQHGRDNSAHQAQRFGAWRGRNRHVGRPVEFETGILDDFLEVMAGMDANETKPPPRAIEIE